MKKKKKGCSGKGFAEKEGFESGTKERAGDEKLIIIISVTVSGINDRLRLRDGTELWRELANAERIFLCSAPRRLIGTVTACDASVDRRRLSSARRRFAVDRTTMSPRFRLVTGDSCDPGGVLDMGGGGRRRRCIGVILGVYEGYAYPPLSKVGGGTVHPLLSATRGHLLR